MAFIEPISEAGPHPDLIEAHAAQGYSLADIARLLGVSRREMNAPELSDAFLQGEKRWQGIGRPDPPSVSQLIAQAILAELTRQGEMTRPALHEALHYAYADINVALEQMVGDSVELEEDGGGTSYYRPSGTTSAVAAARLERARQPFEIVPEIVQRKFCEQEGSASSVPEDVHDAHSFNERIEPENIIPEISGKKNEVNEMAQPSPITSKDNGLDKNNDETKGKPEPLRQLLETVIAENFEGPETFTMIELYALICQDPKLKEERPARLKSRIGTTLLTIARHKVIQRVGKSGNAPVYRRAPPTISLPAADARAARARAAGPAKSAHPGLDYTEIIAKMEKAITTNEEEQDSAKRQMEFLTKHAAFLTEQHEALMKVLRGFTELRGLNNDNHSSGDRS